MALHGRSKQPGGLRLQKLSKTTGSPSVDYMPLLKSNTPKKRYKMLMEQAAKIEDPQKLNRKLTGKERRIIEEEIARETMKWIESDYPYQEPSDAFRRLTRINPYEGYGDRFERQGNWLLGIAGGTEL